MDFGFWGELSTLVAATGGGLILSYVIYRLGYRRGLRHGAKVSHKPGDMFVAGKRLYRVGRRGEIRVMGDVSIR